MPKERKVRGRCSLEHTTHCQVGYEVNVAKVVGDLANVTSKNCRNKADLMPNAAQKYSKYKSVETKYRKSELV